MQVGCHLHVELGGWLEAAKGTYWVFAGEDLGHYSCFTAIKYVITKKYKRTE